MALRHRLAALIWAAILVVAAQFIAGSAFAHSAHSGHAHHQSAAVSSPSHTEHNFRSSAEAQPVQAEKSVESFIALGQTDQPAAPSGNCTGGCCGSGIGCCGAVLAGSLNALSSLGRAREIVSITFERGLGIDPEALARPPRILA
ncbi:MAG: hypothetical protein EPO23_12740 [Xanthobacteraceae bacterium]|nr:MAG: hypothetical protein EPO23_12740 [Xanthobacteraceae bacterium]